MEYFTTKTFSFDFFYLLDGTLSMKDIEGNGVMVTTDTNLSLLSTTVTYYCLSAFSTVNAPPAFLFALLNPDLFMRGWSGVGKVMFMLDENSVLVSC